MNEKVNLKVDWCNYEASKFAVMNWHYSKTMPVGKIVKIGVWEDNTFIGCVLFSRGANNNIGKMFRLEQTQVCELTRVALDKHKSFVSEILAKAIKLFKESNPGVKLIISYADSEQDHKGGIYQASNWIYIGRNKGSTQYIIHGKRTHAKTVDGRYGRGSQNVDWLRKNVDPGAEKVVTQGKHKYLFPLSKRVRKELIKHNLPYPNEFNDGQLTNDKLIIDLSNID